MARRNAGVRGRSGKAQPNRGRRRKGKTTASSPALIALGEKAEAARVAAGYTLRQAGPLVGLSHSQLSRIERGALTRMPKRSTLIALARAYGCPVEEFLEAARLPPLVPSKIQFTEEQQFGNLMLHEAFGPEGMRPEFLPHFPPLHQRLVLELFLRAWNAGGEYARTGQGPVPDDVLGEPPREARSVAFPRYASQPTPGQPRVQTGLFEEDDDG